ncbi:MAG: pyruvate, phosphate dikinase [Candidatus Omnitrophica bacterium]|nr:pyruvate, phosphate dikinase [Candidatus Omnitrophota bacterium]MBU1809190.1 pyruvate, phosphate dikinase [Candidatus Omnitrophota bacterium]
MVRLKDGHGLRTYYATFSLQKDENGGFPISVYTEEQYRGTAGFIKGAVVPAYVYFFGDGKTSAEELFGNTLDERKIILGGKGEGLHSMVRANIPVPPGFTITTDACNYYALEHKWPEGLKEEVDSNVVRMEKLLRKAFGDNENPLLVAVRSGAKLSMPGMMDTILNLGLNDAAVLGFANKTGNERLAWDSYRRLIQMFSDVVLGIEKKDFERIIEAKKEELGVKQDVELDAEALKDLVVKFKALVESHGKVFPQDVRQQLTMAINAVFESWNNPRAVTYRNLYKIPHDLGTAVNVQAMVFGNTGNQSATGVGFTRNPSTGAKELYGEFLINAQGEDVVAGTRTPQPISQLRDAMPEAYKQLMEITNGLEKHYGDMQDFEFTVEDGTLYLLQTRSGKRTGVAAVKVAVDMVKEGLITKEEALMRVNPQQFNEVLFPTLDPQAKKDLTSKEILATGLSAGPGAATGQIVFTSEDAVEWTKEGKQVILWRKETCPDDIAGMDKAIGVGTSVGGMTSHAALVSRGMGKVTMVGAGRVDVNYEKKEAYIRNESGEVTHTLKEGDWVTLNVVEKEPAQLILGKKDIVRPEAIGDELAEFLSWAKKASRLRVWANAEIPHDAKKAFSFGAEGIGLCRTEHMFFGEDRLPIMQEMILADSVEAREAALNKLLPMQREDFIGLFREMKGYPVTIRTLDPPLHEFLPKREELMVEIKELELTKADPILVAEKKKLLSRINELHEFNPMMGMRGTRLGIMMPEITVMQARAIAEATVAVIKEGGKVVPEIMIPLVGKLEEFTHQKKIVADTVETVMKESGVSFQYRVGTMIEVPRGALTADELAMEAEFFSFGTNDLTQYGAGFSRDDIGKFMAHYLSLGIYPLDPFETFDAKGIGELVRIAVEKGRKTNPDLKIGVCGEHGGDPESIQFFDKVGLDYVSCSPYRVLGAWLAAAQATIKDKLSKSPVVKTESDGGLNSKVDVAQEITAMVSLASEAGAPMSMERYNLLVTSDFFANGELEGHRAKYGDRFDLDRISGVSTEQFVDNILAKASGKETKTIALVTNDLSAEQLERLTKVGIRFVRVDTVGLLRAKADEDADREKFQIDTYAMMLLLRRIDSSITADSSIYRLLSFYLKSHFELTGAIAVDDYINAVVTNDVMKLIRGLLLYRPIEQYRVPDYNNVAATLVSA